jgi:hypothetical protein
MRTTAGLVQKLLGDDYDGTSDLTPYLETATVVVSRLAVEATNANRALSYTELELVERWLSAHFYTKMDPVYTSMSTGGASGSFARGSEPEPYKDGAINVDFSGMLKAILNRQTARGFAP